MRIEEGLEESRIKGEDASKGLSNTCNLFWIRAHYGEVPWLAIHLSTHTICQT